MARRKKSGRAKARRKRKAGGAYERVVAEVARAMAPGATVLQGEWVTGPDGERELDVLVKTTVDGEPHTVLVECKDFDPESTGPVGIEYVDALESKRHDLGVDTTLLCCNAGFTAGAIRKADRVNIGLIGVMRRGDNRIRFLIAENLYTRQIQVEKMLLELYHSNQKVDLSEEPSETTLYEGIPLANWVKLGVLQLIQHNPVVTGSFLMSHRLKEAIAIELSTGPVQVDRIDFRVAITGGWCVQEVTYDLTAGLYDWIRRRVRPAEGPGRFEIHDVDIYAGKPISRPPDHVLSREGLAGEIRMDLVLMKGMDNPAPVPDIARLVNPEDLDFVIPELPVCAYTSTDAATIETMRQMRREAK